MGYKVLPCNLNDSDDLAVNNMSAFWTDPTWRILWRQPGGPEGSGIPLNQVIANSKKRMPWNLICDRETRRHTKAVDDDGRLVGYARWSLPESRHAAWPEAQIPEVAGEERKSLAEIFYRTEWNPRSDMAAVDIPIEKRLEELKSGKEHLMLDYLAVHPDNARRGIATLLVQNGMAVAEKLGLDIFVLSFEAGLNIYKRLGFRLLDQLILNDSVYGGKGEYGRYYMVFSPSNRPDREGAAEKELT